MTPIFAEHTRGTVKHQRLHNSAIFPGRFTQPPGNGQSGLDLERTPAIRVFSMDTTETLPDRHTFREQAGAAGSVAHYEGIHTWEEQQ